MSEAGKKRSRQRGLGSVFQRGNVYWIQYRFRGKTYRESSHSTKRSAANALLRKRLAEMGQGKVVGATAERFGFEDLARMLINDYKINGRKSLSRANSAVANLREYFGLSRAIDITTDRIASYIRWRQEGNPRPAKPATIRLELAALKRMFTLAVQAEVLDHRPHIPNIEVRNTRQGFFEEPEFRAVLSHLPEDVAPVLEFAYLTGWRIGEILPLQWAQVDFEAGTVRLEPGTTKNDEGRVFPFVALPPLEDLLESQRERTTSVERARDRIIPWVFHRQGKPIRSIRKIWGTACDAAGVSGRLVHDLRRTAVRNLERAGVPRSVAMKLTGHKTESVYRRYAIVSEADLSEGVEKLAALHGSVRCETRKVVPIGEAQHELF